MPKQIQGNLFESSILRSNLNYAEISGRTFFDGMNNYNIGMFIDKIFHKKDCPMEEFKEYIENLKSKAFTKDKSIKDWRNQNTIERNGKKYVPLCRIEKINHETPKAYLVFFDQWIPKSRSFKDKKYIYCEEWRYKKIGNGSKKDDYFSY